MDDTYIEYEHVRHELQQALKTLRTNKNARDNAEKNYRQALSKKILSLRAEGLPATLIQDVARGCDEVVELRLKRDIAQSLAESNQEAINVKKIEFKALVDQMNREWSVKNDG